MNTEAAPTVAPALRHEVLIGSIGIRVVAHAEIDGAYFVQARDVRFYSPRQENLDAALALLQVKPAATEVVIGGMFAGVTVTAEEFEAANAVAASLRAAVDAFQAAKMAAIVAATTAEA